MFGLGSKACTRSTPLELEALRLEDAGSEHLGMTGHQLTAWRFSNKLLPLALQREAITTNT